MEAAHAPLDARLVRAITAITVTGLLSGRLWEAAWVVLLLFVALVHVEVTCRCRAAWPPSPP